MDGRNGQTVKHAFHSGCGHTELNHAHTSGWEFLESLALAALDSERYDASDVGRFLLLMCSF